MLLWTDNQWIFNILNGESEQNKILAKDFGSKTGFVFIPDEKYDIDKTLNADLHVLAIVNRDDWPSIRSLVGNDALVCMEKIKQAGKTIMNNKFGLSEFEYLSYISYLPTFFHLHVHFVHVSSTSKNL